MSYMSITENTVDDPGRQLTAVLRAADVPGVAVPLSTQDMLRVLAELGYDVDRGTLAHLVASGRIPGEPYDAAAVLDTLGAVEALRLWRHDARLHAGKMPVHFKHYLEAKAAGGLGVLAEACRGQSVRELVILMTLAPSQEQRERILPLLLAKLSEQNVDEFK